MCTAKYQKINSFKCLSSAKIPSIRLYLHLNHNPFPSSHLSSYNFASLFPSNPTHLLYPLKHSGFATVLLTLIFPPTNNLLHRRLNLLPVNRHRNLATSTVTLGTCLTLNPWLIAFRSLLTTSSVNACPAATRTNRKTLSSVSLGLRRPTHNLSAISALKAGPSTMA